MVARAARTLQAGDEVTFAFFDIGEPLDVRRTVSTEYRRSFWCNCQRCQAEENLDPRLQQASDELQKCFAANSSRSRALKEDLALKFEFKRLDMEKRQEFFTYNGDRDFHANLVGLADRWREANGIEITDDKLDMVRESLPKEDNQIHIKVPQDLLDQLIPSIQNFEKTLDSCKADEQLKNWMVMSHMGMYKTLLTLMLMRKDVNSTRWLAQRIHNAVAGTAPGCYEHVQQSVFNWESAMRMVEPARNPQREEEETGILEKEALYECLKLRYGSDLSLVEMEAAVQRMRVSQDVDENWCWELSWCLGAPPRDESKNQQAFGDNII